MDEKVNRDKNGKADGMIANNRFALFCIFRPL